MKLFVIVKIVVQNGWQTPLKGKFKLKVFQILYFLDINRLFLLYYKTCYKLYLELIFLKIWFTLFRTHKENDVGKLIFVLEIEFISPVIMICYTQVTPFWSAHLRFSNCYGIKVWMTLVNMGSVWHWSPRYCKIIIAIGDLNRMQCVKRGSVLWQSKCLFLAKKRY